MSYNLSTLYYPSFILAIPNTPIFTYIPNITKVPKRFSKLETIQDTVLVGYKIDNRLCFYDAISLKDYKKKKFTKIYDERRKLMHTVLASLCSYDLFNDLYYDVVFNPKDVKDFYIEALKSGNKSVIVKSKYSLWGADDDKAHVLELKPGALDEIQATKA